MSLLGGCAFLQQANIDEQGMSIAYFPPSLFGLVVVVVGFRKKSGWFERSNNIGNGLCIMHQPVIH